MDRDRATLNDLEGVAPTPDFDSYLVSTVHRLRSKPLGQFTVEDLRICIGQGVGLRWLLPMAVEVLIQSPLSEGDFYPGDLLLAVMSVPRDVWGVQPELEAKVAEAARQALVQINEKVGADPALAPIAERIRSTLGSFRGGAA